MSKIRINTELENSTTAGSIIVTDSLNEAIYLAPGTIGQVLTIDGSGVPNYATPSGGGTITNANNGLNIASTVAKLGGPLLADTSVSGTSTSVSTGFGLTLDTLKYFNANFENINLNLDVFKFLHTTSVANAGHLAYNNLFLGKGAGQVFDSAGLGVANTAIGTESMNALVGTLNAAASSNTAVGYKSMRPLQYGVTNVALGTVAMGDCGTGTSGSPIQANVAVGHHALRQVTGSYNVAMGQSSLENLLSGTYNVGLGQMALQANTAGDNVAVGAFAGWKNTTTSKNVFIGKSAGQDGVTSEKNFYGGWQAGMYVLGVGANVAIGSGAMQGVSTVSTGNTNVVVGNNAFNAATSGSRNVFIGNNAVANGVINATSANDCIVIGNASTLTSATATNELNIGKALYGANIYSTNPRFALGKAAGINSTLDMGGCYLPIILPKNASIPTVGLESGMLYYNSNTNTVDMYDGTSWGAIQRKQPITTSTSASGVTWNSAITPHVVLNATSNSITQTIPAHSSAYTGWVVEFRIIGASVNSVTFGVPSSAFVNGVIGATSFTATNGNVIVVINDGTQWIITNK